jgi:hypothetical protein
LRAGDHDAAFGLWRRYFDRMSQRARQRLVGNARAADGEDAALSAFDTFCRHVSAGEFAEVLDRNELWGLLAVLTERKARGQLRRERSQKRGGHLRRATLSGPGESGTGWSKIVDPRGEMPEGLDMSCRELLARLADETLERIAVLRLEGCANQEIAEQLGIAERSVERKLARIRSIWRQE